MTEGRDVQVAIDPYASSTGSSPSFRPNTTSGLPGRPSQPLELVEPPFEWPFRAVNTKAIGMPAVDCLASPAQPADVHGAFAPLRRRTAPGASLRDKTSRAPDQMGRIKPVGIRRYCWHLLNAEAAVPSAMAKIVGAV